MRSISQQNRIARLTLYALLIFFSALFITPFLWLVSTSVKPDRQVMLFPPRWIPTEQVTARYQGKAYPVYRLHDRDGKMRTDLDVIVTKAGHKITFHRLDQSLAHSLTVDEKRFGKGKDLWVEPVERTHLYWGNYKEGLAFIPFFTYLKNTLIICFFTVLGTLISCSLVAYGLSRIPWRGRDALFIVLLATMMLPFQVTMVPMFAVFKSLGWLDTFLPLTVPAFLGNAFFIFLLRQFFMSIPVDLSDAARLDGCSEFDIYRRVILPLSKPALATVGLFAFMGAWNDYAGPLIYLFDESHYTLSLGLAMFSSQYGSYWNWLMAVSTVVTVPIILLFFLTQRTFIQGITMTGMKG